MNVIRDAGATAPFVPLQAQGVPDVQKAGEVWRQEVHVLDRAPNSLLILLGRFEHRGRCVCKLRHVIDIPTRLHIPTFSGQGVSTH